MDNKNKDKTCTGIMKWFKKKVEDGSVNKQFGPVKK
jgi:hypothetical protein